jgi:sugar phosphate isomerase/epimerase
MRNSGSTAISRGSDSLDRTSVYAARVYGKSLPGVQRRARVALQLYTVRDAAAADLDRTLERVARIGFAGVEPAGLHGSSARKFRERCRELGLEIPAVHAELGDTDDASRATLADVAELGARALVIPMLPPDTFSCHDEILRAASRLEHAARFARGFGLDLGYHNHEWEFASRIGEGTAHAALFAALAPEIFAEVDVYWTRVGGCEPAAELRRLGPRARFLHVKDGPARDTEAPMTAVGEGSLDIPSILAAAPFAEWHVVELDHCSGDLWQAIERSHAYLMELAR